MKITAINNEQDYQAALKEIERLWDIAKPNSIEGTEFGRLTALVDEYERNYFSDLRVS